MSKRKLLGLVAGLTLAGHALAGSFTVTSADFRAGGNLGNAQVFNSFGCSGGNVSPALDWSGAPAGTKSFAVTAYDPDAPTGSGWWHWLVINLPADTMSLPRGAGSAGGTLPAGAVQTRTDFGQPGYGGPCPPTGDKPHRYIFTVFALKTDKLPLDTNTGAAMVGYYLNQNKLGTATITGYYGR